ncbi:uncharacterized protein LOC129870925 [Solanum dulcamara]|uniref:uncharacterized protein LOC129870925 n=1 Tax=Solanum dulcamara TaxID=45834 RepID=UPI00248594D6|nr:uncharacterized protein LOC129870925 [Solanum dulcamara]
MGGNSEYFPVEMGLHQGFVLSPFVFSVMDKLTCHIQGEVPWCLLIANDFALIEESRGRVNGRLEVWRYTRSDRNLKCGYPEQSGSDICGGRDEEERLIWFGQEKKKGVNASVRRCESLDIKRLRKAKGWPKKY